jgi:hypothetical protein
MKALVVYESMFGNTETIARAIASGLGDACDVTLADVTTMPYPSDVDLLIVGAPTHAFGLSRPGTRQDAVRQGAVRQDAAKIGLREYLDAAPMLAGLAAAAFDTRVIRPFLPGSAARKADRQLRRLGCRMLASPVSFEVTGTAGPLAHGETGRAERWAHELAATLLTERHRV